MDKHAAPNYKNFTRRAITLRLSLYPDRTLGERIKKSRLEQGLFHRDLARMVAVDEMSIVNWERGRTNSMRKNWERLEGILKTQG